LFYYFTVSKELWAKAEGTHPLRDCVSSRVQVCYVYPENVPNLLDLGFVIPAIIQALLVIGRSDISVLLRRIHILQTLPQTWRTDVFVMQ